MCITPTCVVQKRHYLVAAISVAIFYCLTENVGKITKRRYSRICFPKIHGKLKRRKN